MGFREDYDRLIEMLATEDKADDILKSKEEFWKLTGRVHGDEPSYEMRLHAFFEWYIFDRKTDGKTIFEAFLSENSAEENIYKDFQKNVHSIFLVKSITPGGMRIVDLFTKEPYFLKGEDASLGFYRNAVFEGRMFSYNGAFYLAPSLCFHPKDSKEIIKYILKKARKDGESDILPLINKLSLMNLKWETYRNIKVKDIYKFEEYENRSWWDCFC